jgi:hypothetical protein
LYYCLTNPATSDHFLFIRHFYSPVILFRCAVLSYADDDNDGGGGGGGGGDVWLVPVSVNRMFPDISVMFKFLFFTTVSAALFLNTQAEMVSDAAWGCNWVGTPVQFQRCLIFIIVTANKEFTLTAGKFVAVSNKTMMNVRLTIIKNKLRL